MTDRAAGLAEGHKPSEQSSPEVFPWTLEVCLSGGGLRATAYALGALLYLVHSGLNKKVKNISSVSGGSITNAFVACECNFKCIKYGDFKKIIRPLAKMIAFNGLLQTWQTKAWAATVGFIALALLILLSLLTFFFIGSWLVVMGWARALALPAALMPFALLGAIGLSIVLAYLLHWRSWPIEKWMATILPPNKTLGALSDLPVDHVFCATDLTFGQPFFFSTADGGRLFSEAYGYGYAPDVRVLKAVRASAAFPPLIPPVSLPIHTEWAVEQNLRVVFPDLPLRLWFTDGGAFNNFGMEWQQVAKSLFSVQEKFAEHYNRNLPELQHQYPLVAWFLNRYGQVQLIVDASMAPVPMQTGPLRRPVVGFFLYVKRMIDLMYESTLVGRSRLAASAVWKRMYAYPLKWFAPHKEDQPFKKLIEMSHEEPFLPDHDLDLMDDGPLQVYVPHSQPFNHIPLYWGGGNIIVKDTAKWLDGNAAAAKAFGSYWPWTGEKWQPKPKQDDVPTTFFRLDKEWTLKLIIEGYLKTREVLFIVFNYKGPPLPTLCEFKSLLNESCEKSCTRFG